MVDSWPYDQHDFAPLSGLSRSPRRETPSRNHGCGGWFFAGCDDNLRASHGVRQRFMVIEIDPKPSANVRQLCRINAPCPPRDLHRASKWHGRRRKSIAGAAGVKDTFVKSGVVRRQELSSLKEPFDRRPEFPKVRRLCYITPRQSMDIGEQKLPCRRLDQVNCFVHDLAINDLNKTDGPAHALCALVIRGLKIYCDKIQISPPIDCLEESDVKPARDFWHAASIQMLRRECCWASAHR